MIRITLIIFILLAGVQRVLAQEIILKKGDKVPDITFNKIINYKEKQAQLSDFKGELIILDFWHKWCASCINAFAELEILQKKYNQQLRIIPVTKDTEKDFEMLRRKSKILQTSTLPFVVEDSIPGILFPHEKVPFYVWLKGDGTFLGTSWETSVNEKNISAFLNGNTPNINIPVNNEKPSPDIFSHHPKKYKSYNYYSEIRKANSFGLYNLFTFDSLGHAKNYGLFDGGNTALGLFCIAFGVKKEDILIKHQELSSLFPPPDKNKLDQWYANNLYTYEIRMDTSNILFDYGTLLQCMSQDLQTYFNLKAKKDTLKRECYVLSRINNGITLPVSEAAEYMSEKTQNGLYMRNTPVKALITNLHHFLRHDNGSFTPIVNETGILYNIDFNLEFQKNDLTNINNALRKYGLWLKKSYRPLRTLILSR